MKLWQKQDGSAAVLAIAGMVMLGIIIAGLLPLMNQELKAATSDRNVLQARYAAEAGAKYAYSVFSQGLNWQDATGVDVITGDSDVKATYKVTLSPTVTSGTKPVASTQYTITAIGTDTASGVTQTVTMLYTTASSSSGQPVNPSNAGIVDAIPTTYLTPTTYSSDQSLATTPNSGGALTGNYYVNGSFNTNSGVNFSATGGQVVQIFVNGNTNLNGNLTTDKTSNLILISTGTDNINSSAVINGNVQIYAAGSIQINASMTGYALIESNGDIYVNSNVSIIKGVLSSQGKVYLNSGVVITGQVFAKGGIVNNGATINQDTTVISNWGQY